MSTWSNTTVCSECGYLHLGKSHVCVPTPRPEPDCRTCTHQKLLGGPFCLADICTNGDRYDPLPPMRLWKVTQ